MTGGRWGHRVAEHAADLRVESWGPSRDAAIGEAVAALAEAYARWPAAGPRVDADFELAAGTDAERLVEVLDTAVFLADARGLVAVAAAVSGAAVRYSCVPAAAVEVVGPAPKGVAWSDLVCERAGPRWRCAATIDV